MFYKGQKVIANQSFRVPGVDRLISKGTLGTVFSTTNNSSIIVKWEGEPYEWSHSLEYCSSIIPSSVAMQKALDILKEEIRKSLREEVKREMEKEYREEIAALKTKLESIRIIINKY